MSDIAVWLKESAGLLIAAGTFVTGVAGAIVALRRGGAAAKADAKGHPTSDNIPDHLVIVQTRLGEMATSLAAVAPVLSKIHGVLEVIHDDLREGQSEIMDRLEKTHAVTERAMKSNESVERAHAAYITSSSQAMQATEGNTRILGQTMGQVRDEVQGLRGQMREIVERLASIDRRRSGAD